MAAVVRFNPTATAIQYDGNNDEDVKRVLSDAGIDAAIPANLHEGIYVVVFMGRVYQLTEQQYRSAMGLV
jgi:hypothetical protein